MPTSLRCVGIAQLFVRLQRTSLHMKRIFTAILVLVVVEALTFYGYSLAWLAEGQPQRAGDPQLNRWAFVCLAAMVIEPALVVWWLVRSRRRQALSGGVR